MFVKIKKRFSLDIKYITYKLLSIKLIYLIIFYIESKENFMRNLYMNTY